MASPMVISVSSNKGVFQNSMNSKNGIYQLYGFTGDVGRSANASQIVKIEARYGMNQGNFMVTGLLHKDVSMGVSSTFGPLVLPGSELLGKVGQSIVTDAQKASQAVSHNTFSAMNAITTRRLWESTSALEVTLELRFIAVNTGKIRNEVLTACTRLQQLAVPTRQPGGIINPPGPSYDQIGGDTINVYVGKFLKFLSVVVTDVQVQYDNKFDINGNPLSAVCHFTFQTYEMINKGELTNITSVDNLDQNFPSGDIQSLSNNQATADSISGSGLSGT